MYTNLLEGIPGGATTSLVPPMSYVHVMQLGSCITNVTTISSKITRRKSQRYLYVHNSVSLLAHLLYSKVLPVGFALY
jgi:hypothetical protein